MPSCEKYSNQSNTTQLAAGIPQVGQVVVNTTQTVAQKSTRSNRSKLPAVHLQIPPQDWSWIAAAPCPSTKVFAIPIDIEAVYSSIRDDPSIPSQTLATINKSLRQIRHGNIFAQGYKRDASCTDLTAATRWPIGTDSPLLYPPGVRNTALGQHSYIVQMCMPDICSSSGVIYFQSNGLCSKSCRAVAATRHCQVRVHSEIPSHHRQGSIRHTD